MEFNFQDSANGGNLSENLIPEISEYIKKEQSFIPGGTQALGMGWTMADAVVKTCGIPLTLPPSITTSFRPIKNSSWCDMPYGRIKTQRVSSNIFSRFKLEIFWNE